LPPTSYFSMPLPPPLLVDDVAASFEHLSPLGEHVLVEAALAVRKAVIGFASSSGWLNLDYRRFTTWARPLVSSDLHWLVLDPLFAIVHPCGMQRLRVHRVRTGKDWRIDIVNRDALDDAPPGEPLGLIDDTAFSGSTLVELGHMIRRSGRSIARVVLCSSTDYARAAFNSHWTKTTWFQCVAGPHRTIHLRDACPCLPFSGRPYASQPIIPTPEGPVPIRLPIVGREHGLWQYAFADPAVRRAVRRAVLRARSSVIERLSAALRTEATIADLSLLGSSVSLPDSPTAAVTPATTLASIGSF